MTTYVLTYRLVKGSPLTEAEFDGNVHNLDDRMVVVEAATVGAVHVVDAQINTAGHLELILSDSTVIDAGPMPVGGSFAASFKGVWTPLTFYHQNDLFTAPSSNWLGAVLRDHTSASTFSWGANDGMGHDYYAVVIPLAAAPTTVTFSATTHTLTLDDVNTYIRTTGDSTAHFIDVTIPTNASVPIPIDSDIHFRQSSDDQIVFMPSGGVTLNFPDDAHPVTAVRGAVVTLKKVGTNEWDLFGRLQQVTA